MISLTEQQIDFIENDIKVRGITSPDLSIDLLDHICCLIENRLDEYKNFETVYNETILLFGENGFMEIQEGRNRLLTFKNDTKMNSTLKISGYASSLMILSGAFFKVNHFPAANMLIVLGVFILTVVFLPLLFVIKFKNSEEKNRNIVLSIISVVSSLMLCSGLLFKIMHWPSAQILILTGCVLLVLGYLPVYFLTVYKSATNRINATATVILIIAGVGLVVAQSGSGISRPVSDSFWRGVVESDQLLTVVKKGNEKIYSNLGNKFSANDSLNSNRAIALLKSETDALISYIDNMKTYLIEKTTGASESDAKKTQLDDLRKAGGNEAIQSVLFSDQQSGFSAAELKRKIESYKHLIKTTSDDVDLSILETETLTVYGEKVSWEKSNFDQLPVSLVLYNLTRMELGVKNAENSVLCQLN